MLSEHVRRHTIIVLLWSIAIFAIILFQFPQERRLSIFFLNKAVAQASIVLIGLSFLLGPLCKIFHFLSHHIRYRKYFGLAGFTAIVLHVILSLFQYSERFPLSWYIEHAVGIAFAITAFVIFFLLAITSTNSAIQLLGGKLWKLLQRTGYIALVYALIHVYVMANPRWQQFFKGGVDMPTSLLIFVFGIAVILARLIVLLLDYFKPHNAG